MSLNKCFLLWSKEKENILGKNEGFLTPRVLDTVLKDLLNVRFLDLLLQQIILHIKREQCERNCFKLQSSFKYSNSSR